MSKLYQNVYICKIYVRIMWLELPSIVVQYTGHVIQTYILHIHVFFYTVLRQFLETGTSDRCLIGIVQLLRFSGFSLYPLSFFLYSPFKQIYGLIFIWSFILRLKGPTLDIEIQRLRFTILHKNCPISVQIIKDFILIHNWILNIIFKDLS